MQENFTKRDYDMEILRHYITPSVATKIFEILDNLVIAQSEKVSALLDRNEKYIQAYDIVVDGQDMLKRSGLLSPEGRKVFDAVIRADSIRDSISNEQHYRQGFLDGLRMTGCEELFWILDDGNCNFAQAEDSRDLMPLPEKECREKKAG